MLRVITTIFLLIFFQPIFATPKLTGSAKQLSDLLQQTKSYQANFVQYTYGQNNKEIQKSTGLMQFQRPGKFRWETLTPSHQIVIANDKWLWIYDTDLQQATKRPIGNSDLTPSHILSGNADNILPKFKVIGLKIHDFMQFLLKPKNADKMPFENLMVRFHGKTLVAITVINKLGQKNQFLFSRIKTNINLKSSLFDFKAPKGVTVLNS